MIQKLKLIDFPERYNDAWCLMHVDCESELRDIAQHSGNVAKLRANFRTRMNYLRENWENAVLHHEWFEKLSHDKDLYSLHIASVNNLRILYVLRGDQAWLLCCFAEKSSGKRDSYERYIPVARKRLSELLEVENNV